MQLIAYCKALPGSLPGRRFSTFQNLADYEVSRFFNDCSLFSSTGTWVRAKYQPVCAECLS